MAHSQLIPQLIWEGPKALEAFNSWLSEEVSAYSAVFIFADSNTLENCYPPFARELPALPEHEVIEIEPGEYSKNVMVVEQLVLALEDLGADRHSLLINLGGGVITDLGGFLGSVFMRGLDFIHVPTTVMGQVDAAWGGKTGVDAGNVKNLIGTFTAPKGLLVYEGFLETLPEAEWRNGWAEVLKHGLIADKDLWVWASYTEEPMNGEWLKRARKIKRRIVEEDPLEQDKRRLLNAGHTAGHAIEGWCLQLGHDLPHGWAVAWGLRIEAAIAVKLGMLPQADMDEINRVLQALYPLDVKRCPPPNDWYGLVEADKKRKNKEVSWSLLTSVGSAVAGIEVDEELAIRVYRELTGK